MGKKSGAAAADALAKILGVYLTTSTREKDRNIDQQRWQANFELQKQQHQVQMQQAAREQAAYERAQAEDQDVAGWLTALKGQGVTPPPEVNTQHELKAWLGMQGDIQDMKGKQTKADQEAELAPMRRDLLKAQAEYYSNKGTTEKPPKGIPTGMPKFMWARYESLGNDLKRIRALFDAKKAELSSIDSMDENAAAKKAEINQKLQEYEGAQIGVFQHMKDMESAVVEGNVTSPEEWDAYNQKVEADYKEQEMMQKQKTQPVTAPKAKENSENAPGFRDPNAQNRIVTLFKGLVNPGPNPFLPNDQGPTVPMPNLEMLTKPAPKEAQKPSGSLLNAATVAAIQSGAVPSYQPPDPVVQPNRMDVIRQFFLGNANPYGN